MLALSILASGPLVNSLREGNTTHFILLLLVVALLLWRAGAEYAAGLVLGLCALFKLPLMLFGLYVLLRGRWRVVAGGATTIGGAVLLSLAVFGLQINIDWYRNCIEPFVGGVMPAFNVQSIDGFLARLETGPALLMEWTPLAASLWHKIVRSIVLSAMFILAFVAMVRGDRSAPGARPFERDALEFSIVLVLAVVTSPVSWSHYYLLHAVAVGALSRRPARPARRRGDALADGRRHACSRRCRSSCCRSAPACSPPSRRGRSCRPGCSAGCSMLAALVRGALHADQPSADAKQQAAAP